MAVDPDKMYDLRGSITGSYVLFKADCIVNSANNTLLNGKGLDGELYRTMGPAFRNVCKELNGCETGKAKISTAPNLKCDYIIHTVAPTWIDGEHGEKELLESCYKEILKLTAENNIKRIAFPALATGYCHFPPDVAADIGVGTLERYMEEHPDALSLVQWVMCDSDTSWAFHTALTRRYPQNL